MWPPDPKTVPMAALAAVITRIVGAKISAQVTEAMIDFWALPFDKITLALSSVGINIEVAKGSNGAANSYKATFTGVLALDSYSFGE